MDFENLDVSCGSLRGHLPTLNTTYLRIDVRKTGWNEPFLDLVCDMKNLPFKSNVFGTIHCSHVLENVPNPMKASEEMIRVTKRAVIVKVPRILSEAAKQSSNLPFNKYLRALRRMR